jgi:hypothetical protein
MNSIFQRSNPAIEKLFTNKVDGPSYPEVIAVASTTAKNGLSQYSGAARAGLRRWASSP